ncbi:MAG: hypothetical protein FRX49_07098 [Trebouxia sp. A1-2]|nr:MAG: hypothetical protein FRX49_07098 [Trebouxia sp. A1-2]
MTSAKPSRTRPTNNQLLYKAHFRWRHYTQIQATSDYDLPEETEACASVTSAFLQVLSTLYAAENVRADLDRNILELLSNNTRRTKVVELSSGTHRVPDELKKHSLLDKAGSQYSTNLDRNRYGTDNQYLSTVIRYDLDYLGLCPCLVDVEIIDAKNGSGTVIVSAGDHDKQQDGRQQDSAVKGSTGPPAKFFAAPDADISSDETHPQPPLKADLSDGPAFEAPAKSGGSELFDALLMAATGGTETTNRGVSTGEAPVNSKQSAHMPRPRSRVWNHIGTSVGEADSLQNAINAFTVDEEIASGPSEMESPYPRTGPRSSRARPCTPIARRGSVSNMLDQSTTQDGNHVSNIRGTLSTGPHACGRANGNRWSPTGDSGGGMHGCKGDEGDRSGDEGPAFSLHSQEGDTEAALVVSDQDVEGVETGGAMLRQRRASGSKCSLLVGVGRQSSAVNLNRLGPESDLKRLVEEVRMMKEERLVAEGALEEARSKEMEQRSRAEALKQELDLQRAQVQRHLTQVSALRVDVQRLSQGKRSAEARAQAAETAAQQCQQEVAALRVLTASMLAQPHPGPFHDLEGTESAKPGFTGEASNSVVDTLTQQQGSRVTDEGPASGNFWSRVPSPSNIQSSQSSVLEGLGSARLPIDQLQLKAAALPTLAAPQQPSAHAAPQLWATPQNSPAGAIGAQGSSQTPWLSSWSQSLPVSSVQPKAPSEEFMGSELTLKRKRSEGDDGEPVDSKASKRKATAERTADTKAVQDGTADQEQGYSRDAAQVVQAPAAGVGDVGADTGSPNNSSHSSSPETALARETVETVQ